MDGPQESLMSMLEQNKNQIWIAYDRDLAKIKINSFNHW